MEKNYSPDNHEQESSVSAEIECYARERMAQGELLTWQYRPEDSLVIFYVPDDIDTSYPEQVAGVSTETVPLPRPTPFSEGEGLKSTERTSVRKIDENTYRIRSPETRSAITGKFRLPPETINRFLRDSHETEVAEEEN